VEDKKKVWRRLLSAHLTRLLQRFFLYRVEGLPVGQIPNEHDMFAGLPRGRAMKMNTMQSKDNIGDLGTLL
jgi:hypothetical protein